jgi:hypothetical protein
MNKQNVAYTYNGILFNLRKERNSNLCYNIDEPWGYYVKWNKPKTTIWSHICEVVEKLAS